MRLAGLKLVPVIGLKSDGARDYTYCVWKKISSSLISSALQASEVSIFLTFSPSFSLDSNLQLVYLVVVSIRSCMYIRLCHSAMTANSSSQGSIQRLLLSSRLYGRYALDSHELDYLILT